MSIFAKKGIAPAGPSANPAASPPDTGLKGEADREKTGPLPIGSDPAALAVRLAAERDRAIDGNSSCCVMICSPERMQGWTTAEATAETARRFANSLRAYDSIFFYGEDRVLVCLPFVKVGDAPSVMERLRDLAHRMPVDLPGGTSGHVTISVGGSMMDRPTPVQETIDRAEKAMEQGRLSGNRTCMWTPDML